MNQTSPSTLCGDIKIAGKYTVDDWIKLRANLLDDPKTEKWQEAYDFFHLRVETRFLNPIKSILSVDKNNGEGYAACVLQCVLIEFLEALYQGKLYRQTPNTRDLSNQEKLLGKTKDDLKNHTQPTEYKSSANLFTSFLRNKKPFSDFFNKKLAGVFYRHFRCGLIHEAATKSGAIIRAKKTGDLDCIVEKNNDDGVIIYRDAFQKSLLDYIESYGNELLSSVLLKNNFIRKMDDIAQIERCFYFAYGSNIDTTTVQSRIKYVHGKYQSELKGYVFIYNKLSKDGSSKANIVPLEGGLVNGVCYEIDLYQFNILKEKYEIGYEVNEVWIKTEEGKDIIAKTFTAKEEFIITDVLPTQEYVDIILIGAKENKLPENYISKYIAVPCQY